MKASSRSRSSSVFASNSKSITPPRGCQCACRSVGVGDRRCRRSGRRAARQALFGQRDHDVAHVREPAADGLALAVAVVDALGDHRELEETERVIPRQATEIDVRRVGVARDELAPGRESRSSGVTAWFSVPRGIVPTPSQYTRSRPRSASGSPSVAISQSSTAAIRSSVTDDRVVQAVVAVHDRRRRR